MKVPDLVRSIETIVHHDGNGAREALAAIETMDHPDAICRADWVLLELAARGFKIVPIKEKDLS